MNFFSLKTRIALGEGSLRYVKSIAKGYERVLILSSRSMRVHGFLNEVLDYAEDAGSESFVIEGVPAEPSYEYVEEVLPRIREFEPDLLIALGGGSVIDVAKAVKVFYDAPEVKFEEIAFLDRFKKPLKTIPTLKTPLIAIPSTSGAGSEVSAASVLRKGGIKYNIVSFEIAPEYAIIDPRLPKTLPRKVARNSGLDVLVHAIEAYVSKVATSFSDALAIKAIKIVLKWLPLSVKGDEKAREEMHYAATMAGIAFLNARLGLCHSMSHKGAWMAPHGLLNAILHPYVMEFNMKSEYARKRYAEIAREIGFNTAQELLEVIREFNEMLKVPSLRKLVSEEKFLERLDEMSEKAYRDPLINFNPVEPSVEEIKRLYKEAFYE
ncbi:MAG: iron-containing alcohol dehydrogenase [Palaeococcus sp.]|uniref:iron-containing alcohol dehydrogenase n=1 Tax=Palaeococcus sp. (in: euryarchaeotes) TaxID=2820298 RepID=UPI0025FD9560|nr:iron-containing alcohol dehydrogenase [Palaeococcus sp. (in: euryarchaeotes)]MCD6558481.1 iron-containing alcohol dehydrogenase [Palaeococcus sp. (in: euryarchaeotes)]